ncbi:MAG: hypothetical protein JO257_01195, partial [Deltaproteobacteria bacterium]|nr:hypothetical protein [Deltaproteobacteria bacterium]
MPTRALGALLAAIAAAAFVVSIVSGAWWDGHPRVDGKVFTAKDVHIGLLGGTGCNTGGTGECQPLPLGQTFTTVAYGELGGLALTTAFAILVAGAAWRIADSRKRLAKLAMVIATLAAAGAIGLLVLGPQIKTSQTVVPPIGWGFMVFGGGIVAMFSACLATLRVEREPLRLKTGAKPMPAAAGAVAGAPAAFDVQALLPQPAPVLPQRAPTPLPRASAHPIAGLDAPPSSPPFAAPGAPPPSASSWGAPPSSPPFAAPGAPPPSASSWGAPRPATLSQPPPPSPPP